MVNDTEQTMSADHENGIYSIPADNIPKFEKQVEKLSRKSEKLGCGRIYFVPFNTREEKQKNGTVIRYVDILFNGFDEPKLNGWSFVARIDHANEVGNIIRPIPGATVPEYYRNADSNCDHCNRKRYRRDTFIVRNEAGEYKQVGATCIKDFLGHGNPEKLAKLAELLGYAAEYARGAMSVGEDRRYLDLETYLSHCACMIAKHGYLSRSKMLEINATREPGHEVQSTANLALDNMFPAATKYAPLPDKVEDVHIELAQKSIEWAQELGEDGTPLNDYEYNIHVLAATGYIEFRSINYASSIVAGYMRKHNLFPQREPKKISSHVGKVGDKIEVEVELLGSFANDRGPYTTWFHRFKDAEGNVFTWSTATYIGDVGLKLALKGKIKDHTDFKGIKQTVLTRCTYEEKEV
jgi:hypothetical protein